LGPRRTECQSRIKAAIAGLIRLATAHLRYSRLFKFRLGSTVKPPHIVCWQFLTRPASPGSLVLDIGFGDGRMLRHFRSVGCIPHGVEVDAALVDAARGDQFETCIARAEALPFDDCSFDLVVSGVVLPYTQPEAALAQMARVLRPGGELRLTTHSLTYGINMVLGGYAGTSRERAYGVRMLVNTAFRASSGRSLPGFLGDTLCTSQRYLRRVATEIGLTKIESTVCGQHRLGRSFICFTARKASASESLTRTPTGH
jgi:SAM-dependent methyltransferase